MKAIVCPQCGGLINNVSEDKTIAECGYCGAKILLERARETAQEKAPEVRDTLHIPLSDYKPFEDGDPLSEPEPLPIEEYLAKNDFANIKVKAISALIFTVIFSLIVFGLISANRKPKPGSATTPLPYYYRTPASAPVSRPDAPTVSNSDALTLPEPVLPRGTKVAGKVSIKVYVTVDEKGNVYEAQAYDGAEPFRKAAVEAAKKAKFPARADTMWSSGALEYGFGSKR